MATIIGFGHRKFVGKSTCGQILREQHGFTEINFADALKEDLIDRFPTLLDELVKIYRPQFSIEMATCMDPVKLRSYLVYDLKPPAEVALAQNYGTEVRRRDQEGYWISRWQERVLSSTADRIVCCDVRFVDEALAIQAFGGKVYRVVRPGMDAFNHHESEAQLDGWGGWDGQVVNAGEKDDLDDLMKILVEQDN